MEQTMNRTTNESMARTAARPEAARRFERTSERPTVMPAVDIYENDDEILLVADLPGVARDQVSIDLQKNELTLSARRAPEQSASGQGPSEWGARDYFRAFLVPPGIDAERVSAELSHGVLRVRLPKSAALKPRRIEVRAG